MSFDAIVFSGGGSRCFWQAGFYDELTTRGHIAPKQVAAVSAGSAMACLAIVGRIRAGLDHFVAATAANRRNFYPRRLLSRDRPAFPHFEMYREAILTVIDDEAFAALKRGPDLHLLIARPPWWLGARTGALLALAAYSFERRAVDPIHPKLCRRLGFRPLVVRAQSCATPEELAELILHSSCTPPFTPLFERNGKPILDGGAVDPVPILALERSPERTLVLLTRHHPAHRIPKTAGAVYVQPSRPIAITKWDYANPAGLRQAFDLGRRDAEAFCAAS
jgi:predicted acylesterase/phospholipase RssA